MRIMKWVFRIIIIFAWSSQLHAQESCTEKLYHANTLYEKGQINEAIEIAKTCATSTNTPAEQWQAYRLLAMAYLANGQQKEARKAAEKMMELNPTYQPSTLKDPAELIRLLESVKVIPKFTFGLAATAGGINTKPRIITTYNGANYTKKYSSKNSWQVGFMMGYNLNEIISIHSGLLATSKKYDINYNVEDKAFTVNEQLTYLDIPLNARFSSRAVNRFGFFADAGGYAGRLMSAESNFKMVNTSTGETRSENNLNALDRRTNWEYGFLTGAGISYKFKPVILAFEARYFLSAYSNSITNTANRYKNENLFYNYYYMDDDLRLNSLAFSISIFYSINYKVIKKKD
jgi:hypothetical protein